MKHSPQSSTNSSLLPESIRERLNAYALMAGATGVGLLALALPAEGKIVYTAAHKRLPVNKDFLLDLNHDGVNDFKFQIYALVGSRRGTYSTADWAALLAYPSGASNAMVGKSPYAFALRPGARIGPKALFNTTNRVEMGAVQGRGPTFYGPWADSGKAVNNRYIGLKFVIKGKIHFGWARFNVKIDANPLAAISAVLTGYAYDTIPNKAIVAGQTKDPDQIAQKPEELRVSPGSQLRSLGMLARGAPAVANRRWHEAAGM